MTLPDMEGRRMHTMVPDIQLVSLEKRDQIHLRCSDFKFVANLTLLAQFSLTRAAKHNLHNYVAHNQKT